MITFWYGKMSGMISVAWVLHNLFYAGCPILHGENLERVDKCLLLLADMLHKNTENGLVFKDVLHMRKACVAIAFWMRQMVQSDSYKGVQRWKAVACDPKEINEGKNEWAKTNGCGKALLFVDKCSTLVYVY